jgi:bacillithiol system protein YtxJ
VIKNCKTKEDFNIIIENSKKRPVFLLKHSTSCPHSAYALERFETFAGEEKRAEFWKVLVIEDRPVSLHIASETSVEHQSPQCILFYNGKALWQGYRNEIAGNNMTLSLNSLSL